MNLSPTKLGMLSRCPHSYKLRYVNNLEKRKESANLLFGRAIHTAVEKAIISENRTVDSKAVFQEEWGQHENDDLEYSSKDTWEVLNEKGVELMNDFQNSFLDRFRNVYQVEGDIQFDLDQQSRVYGRADYVGDFVTDDGEIVKAIVDFKTSSRKYSEDKVNFDDQLTAYSIGAKRYPFEIDAVIFVVFVKTKTPAIQVVIAPMRTQEDMNDYMDTAKFHLENIYRKKFPKIKGDHCSWCDYCGVCIRQEGALGELIIKITKYNTTTGNHDILHKFYPGQNNYLGEVEEEVQPMKFIKDFIKEYDIPSVGVGFRVQKIFGDYRKQTFNYWWENGSLQRVYKTDQKEAV